MPPPKPATKAQTTNKNNFDMLKQGLTDEIKFANKDMDESKKEMAESGEIKAGAEGDLSALLSLWLKMLTKAQVFESETTSRGEELKALAMVKKAVVESTSGAAEQSFSFMQMSTSSDLKNTEVVQFIKKAMTMMLLLEDLSRLISVPESGGQQAGPHVFL